MSKSYNNTIELFESEETTRKKVMSMVTDSRPPEEPKDPETCNIFALHKLFSQKELPKIAKRYREGKISYRESKEILAKNINDFLRPIRKKKQELDKNPDYIKKVLNKGKEKALVVANQTLEEVKKKIGVE
jgi:tryptophanyl-tRNA synthetase